jgi:4-amino-4-deoxy-L-arabinose transferase-like glycosyltransferase
MTWRLVSYKQMVAAMSVGLVLRLFFIGYRPFYAGDTRFYEELSRNWLYHGVYGLFVLGKLTPVDMRMPGYPAFLAAIYAVFGTSRPAVMVIQALVDLMTCVLTALIAAHLAPTAKRSFVATAALWMAVLCPFTANYAAAILTETLATFFTTLAILLFLSFLTGPPIANSLTGASLQSLNRRDLSLWAARWLLGGFVVGLGTLVRPEAPLLLAAVAIALTLRWWRKANWSKLVLAGSWMAVGLLLPLMPWAARNARTLGRVEFLGPRYAESQGDFVPRGFYAWTQTWMVRPKESYLVPWKLGRERILIETLPNSAFDSAAEYTRVDALLKSYNADLQMTPMLDRQFSLLAQERTARRPLRSYLFVPAARAWMLWFTPRVELLPYSGDLWPPLYKWRSNHTDFGVTLGYGILGIVYVGLALVGAWRCRSHPAWVLLISYLALRTALLTQLQTVEPRYTIVCFPLVLALGAIGWVSPRTQTSKEEECPIRTIRRPLVAREQGPGDSDNTGRDGRLRGLMG